MVDPCASVPGKSLLRRWNVMRYVVIALLGELALATLNLSTMQVYLKYDRQFGESVIGFVVVAFLLTEAIFKGPFGHLADKIGPKKLMLIGPCLSVGTTVLSLTIPHSGAHPLEVTAFIALRLVDGLGSAMLWPALFVALGEELRDNERQEGMSYMNLCYMLGIAFAFPLGGFANDITHVRYAGIIVAGVLFAGAAIIVWFLVPNRIPVHHHEQESHGEFKISDFIQSIRKIPQYLLLSMVTFTGVGFPLVIFKIFPTDEFRWSESMIALLILPGALSLACLSVPMSKYGERIGKVKAVHVGLAMCSIGLWIIAMGAFLPFWRHWWILAVAAIPIGVGFLLAIPAWMASVSEIDPAQRGANIGAIMTSQGLGGIIGAPIGAALYEKLVPAGQNFGLNLRDASSFAHYMPFVGCAACVTLGWILSLRILRDHSGKHEAAFATSE